MEKERRTYSQEFKREVLQLLETSGKSANALEQELGIGKGCILRWKKEAADNSQAAFPGQGHLTAERQRLRDLEWENEVLRQERDILKKAVAIFSRPSR
ncbi:MAG: transposase [Chloroflexi bacterium]|nr:transposase [Chloroflexota bacterium]